MLIFPAFLLFFSSNFDAESKSSIAANMKLFCCCFSSLIVVVLMLNQVNIVTEF
ncbi:hypothetical protein HanHA89_Chr04g0135671 [Helianthus annuus]|nr:hypothetical protein HanHA89_Chr04g0135671 [Helianthus annuus]